MNGLIALWRWHCQRSAARWSRTRFSLSRQLFSERLEDRSLLSASQLLIDADPSAADGVLVQLRDEASASWAAEGLAPLSQLTPHLRKISLPPGADLEAHLNLLRAHPDVRYAEPNYAVSLAAIPNDPSFDALWGMNNVAQTGGTLDADIDAAEAWDISTGSGQTIVAVIDTGVDYRHEDLAANMWVNPGEIPGDGVDNDGNGYVDDVHGYDFANNDGDPLDDHNHGTHVAGTIGAVGNNGIGVAGVNWDVQIMAVKFLAANGGGNIGAAIEALDYAVDNGAVISNNSWGFNGGFSQALHDAVAAAQSEGHIFVAAAGNGNFAGVGLNNDLAPFWPSNVDLDNVVAVAALDDDDQRATFSNFGPTTVDVGAPGVDILSTTIGDTYSTFSGTSMAAPHAAGVIALLWDANPTWSYEEAINRLFTSVDPVAALDGITTTGGRVNAAGVFANDVVSPYIVSSAPSGDVSAAIEHVRISFSEMIDPASFDAADIVSLTGPTGTISVIDVQPAPNSLGRAFDIMIPTQNVIGDYQLVVGADITDLAGNLLDQDGDGVGGEIGDDHYQHDVTLLPFVGDYDFGTPQSAVAPGFTQVLPWTAYTPSAGFGFVGPRGVEASRTGGDALTSDLIYGASLAFVADVPSGAYDLTLTLGDLGPYEHDLIDVLIEGAVVATVSTAAGEVQTLQFSNVPVGDGQLTLDLVDQGGIDGNVVINGLSVRWAAPDTFAPVVIGHTTSGPSLNTVDRVRLTFSEYLGVGEFTIDDVVDLSGPNGPIAVASVTEVTPGEFDVNFAEQTTVGSYQLTLGANIADQVGNLIDQDGDGLGGETPDDHYTAVFEVEPLTRRFDFGAGASAVAPDFTQVTPASLYSATSGYGWQGSGGAAVDRATADPLASDLAYGQQLTFEADVTDGVYDVTLTIGDAGPHAHESMQIALEGVTREVITTQPGEVLTRSYTSVAVSDGRLTLDLTDLGGADPNVVLNGLEMIRTGPDVIGPRVVAVDPPVEAAGAIDRVRVSFDEGVLAGSFTAADVVLAGPSGPIAVSNVVSVGGADFDVVFPEQTLLGTYQITLGPDVDDLAGNAMDQDGDGVGGESPDDQFTHTFDVVPIVERFDFGTFGSPIAADHTQVTPATVYSASNGYGYVAGSAAAVDRFAGSDAARDLNYAASLTFGVDGADGIYDVELTVGDAGPYGHDAMDVYLEGLQVDSVNTAPGEIKTLSYSNVTVSDGQLTLTMTDSGGADANVVINALSVSRLGPDVSPPRVVSVSPAGETTAAVDRITVDFNKAIDPSTFTPSDVVLLDGPNGPITPTSVDSVSATSFEIVIPLQSAVGNYAFTIGPDIRDVDGRQLDQDQDGVAGEPLDDQFAGSFSVAPLTARFDFGTSNSPVANGFDQVLTTTNYSASLGYGWQSGGLIAVDRGGGALAGDLVYAPSLTFAVDLPEGAYSATLTMGDNGPYAHEAMDVFVEGVHIDSVTTSPSEVVTRTYDNLAVVDGQFTLIMTDVGGADPNVVLNGLEIVAAGPATTRVISTEALSTPSGAIDRVRYLFNRAVDPATFTPSDVVAIDGPHGAIAALAVEQVSTHEFDVVFGEQSAAGEYSVTIGPDIAAIAGGILDQDGDGLPGETPDDQPVANFTIDPFSAQFDFGAFGSPVESGYVNILPGDNYSATTGYGYLGSAVAAIDRVSGSNLERDIHYGGDLDFRVDVPDGTYAVTASVGDRGPYAHETMGVFLEGQQVDTVSTQPGVVSRFTYADVNVSDGSLEFRLLDLGGPDVNAVLAGLEITAQAASATAAAAATSGAEFNVAAGSWIAELKAPAAALNQSAAWREASLETHRLVVRQVSRIEPSRLDAPHRGDRQPFAVARPSGECEIAAIDAALSELAAEIAPQRASVLSQLM